MGKAEGFKEIKREDARKENPVERIKHFKEFVKPSDESFIENQSSRCMDCGVPFCHSACPLGNLIPDFNDAVYHKDWKKAFQILDSTNNFPEITGRICPAPCESSCVLSINNDAVSIENIEKEITDKAFDQGWVKPKFSQLKSQYSIAIVGSGPTGLATADELSKLGYQITVFEKSSKIGGLLRYGIPDFKLSKNIIDRRVEILKLQGIIFKTNTCIGTDVSIEELKKAYDAVLLSIGCSTARKLNIPGNSLKGIHLAMDFLKGVNQYVGGDNSSLINCKGKNIVVIGGGDTGSDCIGSARRLGAQSVTQIELLNKPPNLRATSNPWPQWPLILRTSSSQEEGVKRQWCIQTKQFISDDKNHVNGLKICSVDWTKDNNGQYKLSEIKGSERIIPADLVFIAIGFEKPYLNDNLLNSGISIDSRSNIKTNQYQTEIKGVFAAGDARMGQSLVVHAIAEGRKVAKSISEYLEKESFSGHKDHLYAL